MPRIRIVSALLAAIAFPSGFAGQGPNQFTLAGVVVREGTKQPLNHALVTIRYVQRRQVHLSYITDADGRFIFPNLPAGKWDVGAEKNGYRIESYQGYEGFSTAVAVGPGLDATHIVFPLHQNSILSATVVDDQGDPVRQAQVWLFRNGVVEGKLSTSNAGQQQTDIAGQCSFGSLRPGTYYAAVSARPWYAQNYYAPRFVAGGQPIGQAMAFEGQPQNDAVEHGDRDVAYPVTFYGDTIDAASAQPITVKDGSEAQVRITLHPVPAWRLTIHEPGAQQEPANETQETVRGPRQMYRPRMMPRRGASLSVPGPGGFPIHLPVSEINNGQGDQEIVGIPGGRYALQVSGPGTSFSQTIEIDGDRVIDAIAKPPISLSGSVTWEGADKTPFQNTWINLVGESQMRAMAHVSDDGSFDFRQNPPQPGRYRVRIQTVGGFVARSVQAKGAEYSNGSLDLTGEGPVQLSIVATSSLAKINGTAVRDNTPCSAAMVLLLPADGNPDAIRRDQSDSDGTFTLPNVPPGRYALIAIDNGRDLPYQDPAVMAKYMAQGKTVEVAATTQNGVSVAVQHRLP